MQRQLTIRGIVIGCIGCVVITAASAYTALKMGALPWPIIFAALISLVFLRLLGSRSLNEANVTHTIMSAGAMVAGGLAFTIPGIWMLGLGSTSFGEMLGVALAGTLLGLVASAFFRKQFIEKQKLEFPIGQAAAETLKAGNTGGKIGAKLFCAMGFSGIWAALRDALGVIPALVLGNLGIPGIAFGIYLSPLFVSVGFLVGVVAMLAWFGGALVQVVLSTVAPLAGVWDVAIGQAISSGAGMGLMMGCGIAVIVNDVLPKITRLFARKQGTSKRPVRVRAGIWALVAAIVAYVLCIAVGIGPIESAIVVVLSFATVAMSAQSVGQTGIDPMEIFGLIVLLVIALLGNTPQVQLFFVAAVVAVACGLGGDVMNDFKAGHELGTSPKAQVIGQAIGGILGAVVAAGALYVLVGAYGPEAFGPGHEFVAAQASVVASLVSGIPHVPAFVVGLVAGFVLYIAGAPAMMIGLGVYLPFYMTFTAFLGCIAKGIYTAVCKRRDAKRTSEDQQRAQEHAEQSGLVVASGLLGGESIVGVIIALVSLAG